MQLLCILALPFELSEREVKFISHAIIQVVALISAQAGADGTFFNPGPEPLSWIIGPNGLDEVAIGAMGERIERMLQQLVQSGYPEAELTVAPYQE